MSWHDDFTKARKSVDRGLPLPAQYEATLDAVGLAGERLAAAAVAPQFVELADQSLMLSLAPSVGAAQPPSARASFDRRRERAEALGQGALDFDLHGSSEEKLKAHLSFTAYALDGREFTVEELLADYLQRAQVMADLSRHEAELRRDHALVSRDLQLWAELKARYDAVDGMAAE